MKTSLVCVFLCSAALLVSCASKEGPFSEAKSTSAMGKWFSGESEEEVIPYPFDTCAVIQTPFLRGGPKHRRVQDGHEVLFCCTPCLRAFDTNHEPYMPRIKEAAAEKMAALNPAPIPSVPVEP